MDFGLVIVWFIVICLIVLSWVLLYTSTNAYSNSLSATPDVVVGPCAPALQDLPSLVGRPCCFIDGELNSSRYMSEYDLVVDTVPKSYLSVCSEFCTNGLSKNGKDCANGIGQANFEQCVRISKPNNCKAASRPVATDGSTYYYPSSAGRAECQTTQVCR